MRLANKMAIFTQHVQCMLLFLVLTGNSAQFQILRSYTLLLKLPVPVCSCLHGNITIAQSTGKITSLLLSVLLQVCSMSNNANSNKQVRFFQYNYVDHDFIMQNFDFIARSDANPI